MLLLSFFATCTTAGGFTDNGNGTVTDQVTTLTWQKQDNSTTYTWEGAISYCEGLSLGGYADWRLPNIKELKSIVDMTRYSPAINIDYFPNTQSLIYWSSTTGADATTYAWCVHFSTGVIPRATKNYAAYVRCVR